MAACTRGHAFNQPYCAECATQERHEAILNVLLEINQTLNSLLNERRADLSLSTIADKLESIKYSLNNR